MKVDINMSAFDRVLRAAAGGALIALGLYAIPPMKWVAIIAGAILAFTGLFGHCCIYKALGVSTLPHKRAMPRTRKATRKTKRRR